MAGVILENVGKAFGGTSVVHNLDLEVKDGEFLVLLGPSGCGKTTTLRMIAGLEQPTTGSIVIDGRLSNHVHPSDRDIAMVFQNYALYPHMSVRQNLGYGLLRSGVDKHSVRARVQELSVSLRLEQLLDRKPAQLSGGQRQRVALGRAVIREPKVFLMDEPLSNLDAKLRVEMRTEVVRLQARLGITTIYVTHDQVEAMTMGDRVGLMNHGRLEQLGSPLELFDDPANRFVAEFMGHPGINMFRGSVVGDTGRYGFVGGGIKVPLSDTGWKLEEVMFGIRPQHLLADRASADNPFPNDMIGTGRVDLVEHLGTESFGVIVVEDRVVIAAVDPTGGMKRGDEVWLRGTPRRAFFFDPETGERLVTARVPADRPSDWSARLP